jgi:rhodanese-related sulfurtransferase
MLSPEITPEEFNKLRSTSNSESNDTTPFLLDVREPWEAQTASIPGATLIPMGDIPSRAHTELDPDQPIIVFCHHGMRSLSVTMWLRREGFEHAQSLAGGIDEWSRKIDPSVPRY